jgi:chitosanase
MPHERGKRVIHQIVSVFETGEPSGDYGACAVLPDGAGISYGLHQATDRADNLDEIVHRYIDRGGQYAEQLHGSVTRLDQDATAFVDPDDLPVWVRDLMETLQRAGREDPVMRAVQDEVFEERYWVPAAEQAQVMGLRRPLSWAVVYDTCIHSGPSNVGKIRNMFAALPPSKGGDEKEWTGAYVRARWSWLASYPNQRVRITKARMEAFQDLIDGGNWALRLPIRVLGITIPGPPVA